MSIPTITVDMNKKCDDCGKAGACQSGLCLKCVAKRIKRSPMKTRKLTEQEIHQRNCELAENVCKREECLSRKADFLATTNKEIKYYSELIVRVAQEVNAGEIYEDPQGKLPV